MHAQKHVRAHAQTGGNRDSIGSLTFNSSLINQNKKALYNFLRLSVTADTKQENGLPLRATISVTVYKKVYMIENFLNEKSSKESNCIRAIRIIQIFCSKESFSKSFSNFCRLCVKNPNFNKRYGLQ